MEKEGECTNGGGLKRDRTGESREKEGETEGEDSSALLQRGLASDKQGQRAKLS